MVDNVRRGRISWCSGCDGDQLPQARADAAPGYDPRPYPRLASEPDCRVAPLASTSWRRGSSSIGQRQRG